MTKVMTRQVRTAMQAKGDGLYLKSRSGRSTWVFRHQLAGVRRDVVIGTTTEFNLRQARDKVAEMRRALANGASPRTALARPTKARTLADAISEYISATAPSWKGRQEETHCRNQLTNHFKSYLKTPVELIRKEELVGVLKTVAAQPSVFEKLLKRIRAVLRREEALDHIRSQPLDWAGLQYIVKPAKKSVMHHPAVPWQDAATFWSRLEPRWTRAAACLKLVILTAARGGEAREAAWTEFSGLDTDRPLWTIPKARIKVERDLVIPLSTQALAVLKTMPRERSAKGLLFPSRNDTPLSDSALLIEQRRHEAVADVHGWRSSFRDWGGERELDPVLLEMSLNHAVGSAVERAYARSNLIELRRPIMQAWADHVTAGVSR